jgi:hypothetical protein
MIKKNSVRIETLNKKLAIDFASMTPMPGEREYKPTRKRELYSRLQAGLFHGATWDYAVDTRNQAKYRCDGQHSSKMLAELEEKDIPSVPITLTEWTTDNIENDAVILFEMFNQPFSSRTPEDVMGVGIAGYSELKAIEDRNKFLLKIARGLNAYTKIQNDQSWTDYERRRKKDKQLVAPQLLIIPAPRELSHYYREEDHRKFALWASELRKNSMDQDVKHIYLFSLSGVIAEMYGEWKRDPKQANVFWTWVLNASHPEPDHESRVLADTLFELKTAANHVTQQKYAEQVRKYYRRFAARSVETDTPAGSSGSPPASQTPLAMTEA